MSPPKIAFGLAKKKPLLAVRPTGGVDDDDDEAGPASKKIKSEAG